MNANRIRFGSHARALLANGWRSIIPCRGKSPLVPDWAAYGLAPPSDALIAAWRAEYPDYNIGHVANGRVVAIDIDICVERLRSYGFTIKDAERDAPALVSKIKTLAREMLGPILFARVGLPPKVMLLYAAADSVPIMAGSHVEVFCTPGSKQFLLYGFHPEAVDEYCWVGPCQPLTHSIDSLRSITSQQAIDFRTAALALCEEAGIKSQQRTPSGNSSGRVNSGIVGDYMSEVLSLIGKAPHTDPRQVAAEYFRHSVDGEKHYRMVAVCGALILRRFTDDEIIAALAPVYRAIVHDDPTMSRLRICPQRVRSGMRARGTNVVTLAQLDSWFGPNWSSCNG
jgi:hypothetical protein